jgi:hypothetical protein
MRVVKIIAGGISMFVASLSGAIAGLFFYVAFAYVNSVNWDPMLIGLLAAIAAVAFGISGWLLLVRNISPMSSTTKLRIASLWLLATVAILIGIPVFVRARQTSATNSCVNNLRQIDGAKQQWALENHVEANGRPAWKDILPYLGNSNTTPRCPQGGTYILESVGQAPRCSIGGSGHEIR